MVVLLSAVGLLFLSSRRNAAAEMGMEPWFACGIVFWGECEPEPHTVRSTSPTVRHQTPDEEAIPPDALLKWGTPVVGPGGAVSYQLPPRPLLELFHNPTDATARSYLTWLAEKTQHREEAFAAIKRVAAEVGYSVGGVPTRMSGDERAQPETLSTPLPPEVLAGLMTQPSAAGEGVPALTPAGSATPSHTAFPGVVPAPLLAGSTGNGQMAPGQHARIFYFFSPRCPYCAQETPVLNELLQGRTDVVGIALDTTREELVDYVRTMGITFPVTIDQGESKAFGITGYPVVVVREHDGAARKLTGLASKEQLLHLLKGTVP
jgi:thiol-disulfide isomerase/thioredoxin